MSISFSQFLNRGFDVVPLNVDEIYCSNETTNHNGDVLCKLMKVGSQGGFRYKKTKDKKNYAYIALESTGNSLDWIDIVDRQTGSVMYYGDNKIPGRQLHGTIGNKILKEIYEDLYQGNRKNIPPMFLFEGAGGKYRRDRRFVGLVIPGDEKNVSFEDNLVAIWRTKNGQRYQNYKATFTILDEATIDRRWLADLVDGCGYTSKYAPKKWKKWVDTGKVKPLQSTPIVEYRKKDEQVPKTGTTERAILDVIYNYFSDDYNFEFCAMKIAQMMDKNVVKIEHTRFYKDGGRDAVGSYRIGEQSNAIYVDFALEAKHYSPDSALHVKELSRVISRLRFRQFAYLITTSYLDIGAYKELKEDNHPVIVVSGGDIVNILNKAGYKTKAEVINWLKQFSP